MEKYAWDRITLLIILFYEAIGCLLGGILLIIAPDGRLMEMPVEMMHGVFPNFLIPGIILFGLGILTSFAFIATYRRKSTDWMLSGLALGGLFIWFVVEIIILKELHWLHLMWGAPVQLGWIMLMPLIAVRNETVVMQRVFLICGIVSSIWYAIINIIVPLQYDGYNMMTLTVSELSAIDAPTRIIWVLLVAPYPLLFAAFGWGVVMASGQNSRLRTAGSLIITYCILNLYWPPMHQRDVIGAGGGTWTDTLHITWAMMTLLLMMLLMIYGAAASGKSFRIFTALIFVLFIVFGSLTAAESPGMQANLPTPHLGLWERINIGAFMLWIIAFAFHLLKAANPVKVFASTGNKKIYS